MLQTKKIVIKSLGDLIEIFPSLTESQIIILFRKCIYEIKRADRLLGLCRNDEIRDALLERISAYADVRDFLSGYLARCYCKLFGIDLF